MDTTERIEYTEAEKLKAVYALNMCTVSVSQIVDYNDLYILEQEYDAILNNLNLKEMPKDSALLKILTEILNTITFFRIQEIKKKQIEKKYKQRVKDAIWSAVPSLNVIVSGNPAAIALSLVTQIGSGYMNYRKEKANAASDKEDSEIELQITAIEQFNALKRELFTTAWRLAEAYDFDDKLRLTEKQIKQYNEILTDTDEYRKYARLEAIAEHFRAYPPFWYFFGHTANYIAEMARNELNDMDNKSLNNDLYYKKRAIVTTYTEKAKKHYEHYYSLCDNRILREDQLTATFALEYVDILWNEESKDLEKIHNLLKLAEEMAPNSFDILQFCSISYLKIGASDDAERLLKILVNEDYNAITNAKLLSRLYVSKFINTGSNLAIADYDILECRVDSRYLYPMPQNLVDKSEEAKLETSYIKTQKDILKTAYTNSLKSYERKMIIAFNAVLPPARKKIGDSEKYFDYTENAREQRENDVRKVFEKEHDKADYLDQLKSCNFRNGFIDVLNQTICGLGSLSCFTELKSYDNLIYIIESRLRNSKPTLAKIQDSIDSDNFNLETYKDLVTNYSYQYYTETFYEKLIEKIVENIESTTDMKLLETFDYELTSFCNTNNLPSPEVYLDSYSLSVNSKDKSSNSVIFGDGLLGIEGAEKDYNPNAKKEILKIINQKIYDVVLNKEHVSIYLSGSNEFETYFDNDNLKVYDDNKYMRKQKAFAIIDDHTRKNNDLVLCVDGVTPVYGNVIRGTVAYDRISYSNDEKKKELKLGYPDIYSSKDVDILVLKGVFDEIGKYLRNS